MSSVKVKEVKGNLITLASALEPIEANTVLSAGRTPHFIWYVVAFLLGTFVGKLF